MLKVELYPFWAADSIQIAKGFEEKSESNKGQTIDWVPPDGYLWESKDGCLSNIIIVYSYWTNDALWDHNPA